MKKDLGVIVLASSDDMTFRSLLTGRLTLAMTSQSPYPSKSGSDLPVQYSTLDCPELLRPVKGEPPREVEPEQRYS
jgi:hypothetical protein